VRSPVGRPDLSHRVRSSDSDQAGGGDRSGRDGDQFGYRQYELIDDRRAVGDQRPGALAGDDASDETERRADEREAVGLGEQHRTPS